MAIKKHWSLLKWASSATAVCSITAISALATSCVANKNNNGDSQQSGISIKDESPETQNVDSDTSLELYVDAVSNVGDLTYQWYVEKNDSDGWTSISGATSNKYEITEEELSKVTSKTTWKYKVEIASAKDPKKNITKEYSVNITPHTSSGQDHNTNEVPTALKFDYDKVNISDLSSAADIDFYYNEKITKRYDRNTNVGYYKTDLEAKYGDKGFRYPSYDYNYKKDGHKYLTLSGGTKVNVMELVYNERTTNKAGEKVKYSNADWIKEQIADNKLKAHPAAKTWYQQNVTKETQAVEKHFTIGAVKTGLYSLGLYAPAGEVITLKFDDETFNLIKEHGYRGLSVVINDNYWDNYPEGNSGEISNRYPFVHTTFSMDPTTNSIKFGSPFGGNISITLSSLLQDSTGALNSIIKPLSFTVSGAVESLNYVHGFTTESDWNRQVKDVLSNKITAPSMSAMYSWSTMNIPFTAPYTVANREVSTIAYPYETFKKWNNFQFLSVYTSRSYSRMLSMKFCDDIWGSAGAWGGGHNVYIPISWAGHSFLSGVENFDIKTSWGIMHEMDHNYQQDSTFFRKMYHNKTNQMSMVNFSLLSDMGRYRNENNIMQEGTDPSSPGWTFLSNSYSNLYRMNKSNGNREYVTYGAILFSIGARNYIEYTRWDAVNHPNTAKDWTGLKEIQALSNYFQVDFWPAFESTYHVWNNLWPANYNTASASEKAIIDSLKKYSSMEFVGNLYAAGSYLYNGQTKQYRYTGDVNAPYEISGYQDYVFDFGTYINSSNPNFNWSNITVESTSKNGVPLEVKDKKVVYSASQAKFNSDVDEFDVTITPGSWAGKPNNYVPGYKWKIKVRNAIQDPKINLYTGVTSWNVDSSNHADEVKKYLPVKSFNTRSFSDQTAYELKGKTQNLLRASFSFIAPSAGTYTFNASWNSSIVVYQDGKEVKKSTTSSTSKTNVLEKALKANEVVTFDIFVYNSNSSCSFDFEVKSNNQNVDLSTSLLGFGAGAASKALGDSYTFNTYMTDKRFSYKPRFEDYLSYIQNTNSATPISNSNFVVPSKNLYDLKSVYPSNNDVHIERLYTMGLPCVEIWDSNKLSFDVDFKTPTQVGSLRFGHRTDNHQQYRPTKIKVTGIDANNKSTVLYNGDYSSKISSRSADSTIVNLNSVATVKTLKIELENDSGNKGMVLNWFSYSPDIYLPLNNNVAADNNYIAKTDGWSFIKNNNNDYGVTSSYGSSSLLTTTKYAAIDFNLKNSNGFRLIGSTTTSQSVFDVYINDKIYQRNVKVGGKNQSNVELFRYALPNMATDLRVTIVNRSSNPLIINFIQTYGYNGPVYTSPINIKK